MTNPYPEHSPEWLLYAIFGAHPESVEDDTADEGNRP